MSLILLFLSFVFTFLIGLFLIQKISNRLIFNFKIIFLINTIIFIFSLLKFDNLDLFNFIILVVNLAIFKIIFLIILQASISSIQLQILYNLNKYGKLNNNYNDNHIFENRFKNFKDNKVLKNKKNFIKIDKKSILFVYYFFFVLKKIYNENM